MNWRGLGAAVAALGWLAGCTPVPMKPSETHVRAEEVRAEGTIPPPVSTPVLPRPRPTVKPETYSVVVSNVRAQELLFALARDAKLNIDIHPEVSGNVTLNAIDQTLPQILNRISRQIDMRYEMDGANLIVMRDAPYLRIYRIDYLNISRDSKSEVSSSSAISGASGGGGSGGGGGGTIGGGASSQQIQSTSQNRFWDTLVNNIKDMLRETDKVVPAGSAASARPAALIPPAPAPGQGGAAAPPAGGAPAAQAPIQVSTPSTEFREAAFVIANAESGILSIRATSKQHEKVQEFIDQVMTNVRRQVLIEATVVEVRLNNQYQQGINWSAIPRSGAGFSFAQPGGNSGPAGVSTSNFTLGFLNTFGNISVMLRFLESFGTLRVLSSPKISVLNNQAALLRVVDNLVYFTIKSDISQNQTQTVQVFTTTVNPYSVGFVMSVTPQVSESSSVLLNVRPTITREIGSAVDPNPALRDRNITNTVPLLQTREMESVLQVQSGQIAVMGGLMQDELNDVEDGIPGVSRIPLVGKILRQNNNTNRKTELVIFLRPTVIRDASVDGDYQSFRPLLPGADFLSRPNPGKPEPLGSESRSAP